MTTRHVTIVRRIGLALTPLAMALLAVGPGYAQSQDNTDRAKLVRATWLEPDETHTIEPYGMITTIQYPTRAITKLPPTKNLKGDLALTMAVTFDTTTGTKAPIRFKERSGILTITVSPDDVKDGVIQTSAIDGTTATVHIEVKADGARLNILKPVYFELVKVWIPGQKKKLQQMEWIWKPYAKHDQ